MKQQQQHHQQKIVDESSMRGGEKYIHIHKCSGKTREREKKNARTVIYLKSHFRIASFFFFFVTVLYISDQSNTNLPLADSNDWAITKQQNDQMQLNNNSCSTKCVQQFGHYFSGHKIPNGMVRLYINNSNSITIWREDQLKCRYYKLGMLKFLTVKLCNMSFTWT